MVLDRIAFDNMKVLDQINYINNKLKEGYSLTKTCETIGINRKTISKRFAKENYIFDKAANIYMESNYKSMTKVKSNDNTSHKSNTIVVNKDKKNLQSIQDFNKIKNDLLELINNKHEILQMLKDYKSNTKIIEVPLLDINTLPGEMQKYITTKTIKVYEPIYSLFDELCKNYNSIKKQDLISLALYEFISKYKK